MPTLSVNTTTAIIGKTILIFTVTPTPPSNWFLECSMGEWEAPAGVSSISVGPFQGPGWPSTLQFYAIVPPTYTNTVTISIQYSEAPLSATLSASPNSGPVPLAVAFTIGIAGGVTPYTWTLDYGDATSPGSGTIAGTKPHTYTRVGTFTATLTATDALGATTTSRSKVMSGVTAVKSLVSTLAPVAVGVALIKVVSR